MNNTAFNNDAGIYVYLYENRIEANNTTYNDRGIAVRTAGNIIVKNTARGNYGTGTPSANYDIAGGIVTGKSSPIQERDLSHQTPGRISSSKESKE